MPRILALVEGHTEAAFFEVAHPNCLVLRPFPNGVGVSLAKIADKIEFSLRTVGGGFEAVVVVLDRERRQVPVERIVRELRERLRVICPARDFVIGVSDIQVENWILADEETMRRRFGREDYSYAGDGTGGKRRLGELAGGESFSPRAKAEILKSCSAQRIRDRSPSFSAFHNDADFDWYWLRA